MFLLLGSPAAYAFCIQEHADWLDDCDDHGHESITRTYLSFLNDNLVEQALDGNLYQDNAHSDLPERHFQGCTFEEGAAFVRDQYDLAVSLLDPADPDPIEAAFQWGSVLHPLQDFYAHANWVELLAEDEGEGQVDPTFVLDGGTGRFPDLQRLTEIRPGIVLGEQLPGIPINTLPGFHAFLWDFSAIPTLSFPDASVKRVLITGYEDDTDCIDVRPQARLRHSGCWDEEAGPTWDCLNKDKIPRPGHAEAYMLAGWQTQVEWCRLLHRAHDDGSGFERASLLMTLFTDPAVSPLPAATACTPAAPGPLQVQITVDRTLVDHDEGDVSNYVLALYTGDFRQSASLAVEDDDQSETPAIPGALSLCVDSTDTTIATLWGWDDDDGDPFGPDSTLLRGPTVVLGPNVAPGVYDGDGWEIDADFRVTIDASSGDADSLSTCAEAWYGTSDAMPDTDGDGLWDDDEIGLGFDPLDPDMDDDGLTDGSEVLWFGTDPRDGDSDQDHVGDAVETGGIGNAPAPDDGDGDGLRDIDERLWGTDALAWDTDADRIPDGVDLDWLADLVLAVPDPAFVTPTLASTTGPALAATLQAALAVSERIDALDRVDASIGCARARLAACDASAAVRRNLAR